MRASWRRASALLVATAALCALAPAAARADGDPASDVLAIGPVFAPYAPTVSNDLLGQVTAATATARRAGYPIRVAMIATPNDLGAYPQLYGRPEQYARLLGAELRQIGYRGVTLVVMQQGFGVHGIPPQKAATALDAIQVDAGGGSDGLARAALAAIPVVARLGGHPISVPQPSGGGSSNATLWGAIAVAVVLAAAIGGAVVWARRRGPREA
jgi:hypothetical protein